MIEIRRYVDATGRDIVGQWLAGLADRRVRAKVAARGLDAYIVESNVPDKGVWYRIRVGRHLEQAEANEAVKKAGKGAIVITE